MLKKKQLLLTVVLNYKGALKALPHRNFDLVTQTDSYMDGSNHLIIISTKGKREISLRYST